MDVVYSWGANNYGQLGSGHLEDSPVPQPITIPDNFEKHLIVDIACGGGHVLVLLSTGNIFSCGWNFHGQLGQTSVSTDAPAATLAAVDILNAQPIYYISAGWAVSLACVQISSIANETCVFCWGINKYGECGMDPLIATSVSKQPNVFKISGKVFKINCGLRHVLLLTVDRILYSWGCNRRQQLGRSVASSGSSEASVCTGGMPHYFPSKVPLPSEHSKPIDCAAGEAHSAVLTETGQVLVWGDHRRGQRDFSETTRFSVIQFPPSVRIQHLSSGWSHLLALSDSGLVFAWGRADYGQTAASPGQTENAHEPRLVQGLPPAQSVFCTSEHSMALSRDTKLLFSWGWNEHGLCGVGWKAAHLNEPLSVRFVSGDEDQDSRHIVRVSCGAGFCWVHTRQQNSGS